MNSETCNLGTSENRAKLLSCCPRPPSATHYSWKPTDPFWDAEVTMCKLRLETVIHPNVYTSEKPRHD